MPEDAEATQSVVQATLTEGAIGYRKFKVISGQKAMAVLRLRDGSYPPFGAEVKNDEQQQVGIVDDEGNVYLAGVNAGEHMMVFWEGSAQCEIVLPKPLPADLFRGLLLPCEQKGTTAPDSLAPEIKPVIQNQTRQVTPSERRRQFQPLNNMIKEQSMFYKLSCSMVVSTTLAVLLDHHQPGGARISHSGSHPSGV